MRVRDVMTASPVTVAPRTSVKDVAALLARRRIGGVPVVGDGRVVGVVSESDLVRKEQEFEQEHGSARRWRLHGRGLPRRSARTAAEAMSAPPVTIEPQVSLAGAAWLMTEHDVARLPVLERGRLVGIVTRSDLVRAFARSDEEIRREILDEVLPSLGVRADEMSVEVRGGNVTIRGSVDDELDARCLPHALRAVVGVVDVDAEIVAQNPHRPAPTPSPF